MRTRIFLREPLPFLAGRRRSGFREFFGTAVRFWEPARAGYNAILLAAAVAFFATHLPESRVLLTFPVLKEIGFFALAANVLYSVVYVLELILQTTMPRHFARYLRVFIWITGTIPACYLALLVLGFLVVDAGD